MKESAMGGACSMHDEKYIQGFW